MLWSADFPWNDAMLWSADFREMMLCGDLPTFREMTLCCDLQISREMTLCCDLPTFREMKPSCDLARPSEMRDPVIWRDPLKCATLWFGATLWNARPCDCSSLISVLKALLSVSWKSVIWHSFLPLKCSVDQRPHLPQEIDSHHFGPGFHFLNRSATKPLSLRLHFQPLTDYEKCPDHQIHLALILPCT